MSVRDGSIVHLNKSTLSQSNSGWEAREAFSHVAATSCHLSHSTCVAAVFNHGTLTLHGCATAHNWLLQSGLGLRSGRLCK